MNQFYHNRLGMTVRIDLTLRRLNESMSENNKSRCYSDS